MSQTSQQRTKQVLIIGAGPAGLLASILLLRRNIGEQTPKYQVTLVDPGTNYGKLDAKGLQRKRSWMIGLSAHGLRAIRSVDGLYENYVRGLGIDIEHAVMGLSSKFKIETEIRDKDSAFTVDRNFICAALARYLTEKYESEDVPQRTVELASSDGTVVQMPEFCAHYDTKALFVDYDEKRVLVREENSDKDRFLNYDLIIGCDGIRSIVRNAIANTNRDFEFSIKDTFVKVKALHVDCPEDVKDGTFFLLRNVVPNMSAFILPETGRKLNVNLGYAMHREDEVDPVLKSDDVDAISAYFKKHFHAFKVDCDDVARQWVAQSWNTFSQVHCNIYHDRKRMILLMGDAAHATSPQIGQGMNTALADAAAFDRMLDSHKDDLGAALDTFSEERVKEGNALTDLSFYTYSFSPMQQIGVMVGSMIRGKLNSALPMLFDLDPMDEVSMGGKLSVAYDKMSKLGIIQKVRATNDKLMREYFEKKCGMRVLSSSNTFSATLMIGIFVIVLLASLFLRWNLGTSSFIQKGFC